MVNGSHFDGYVKTRSNDSTEYVTIWQSVGCESTLLFTPFTVTKVLNSYEEILNMEINWGELTYGK